MIDDTKDAKPDRPLSELARSQPQTPKQQKSASPTSGFEAARDRKFDAAVSVATGGDNSVADVLTMADQIANERLAADKKALAEKLADQMVAQRKAQIEEAASFFIHQWNDTSLLLAPFQEYLDAEVIEAAK